MRQSEECFGSSGSMMVGGHCGIGEAADEQHFAHCSSQHAVHHITYQHSCFTSDPLQSILMQLVSPSLDDGLCVMTIR